MFRKLTLSFFLTLFSTLVGNFSFATTYTYPNDFIPNPLDLNNGDVLVIASGTYTGTVRGLNSNTITIIVENGATFQPTSLQPDNGVVCNIQNYGTFTYTSHLTTNNNFKLDNYAGGIVNLASMNTKGRDQLWTNHIGGTMNFSGEVSINGGTQADDNNKFINYETINAAGDFIMRSGSYFTNYKDFNVVGNYKANGGSLRNEGNFVVTGKIEINSGATPISNYCRMEALGGIDISNATFFNYSYVWARNSEIKITNGGITNINIPGASPPMIHGASYYQTGGAVTGPALMYFYGTTTISGGTVGVSGVTSDTIKMHDITRSIPTAIFDDTGTPPGTIVNPNVIYNAWGAPDSLRTYLTGCSVEIFLEIPLAINWNSFVVSLMDNVPKLDWSAEFQQGTVFEIQRSYDSRNFSGIKTLAYEEGQTAYEYRDRTVNRRSDFAYYRIKAIEISGVQKYTQIRSVRFSHKPGSIYTAPNPFTSDFILNYRAAEKETITIRMFNVSGQQMLTKNVTVNNGNNAINITEAAQFGKGIYVIQVIKGSNMISSGKIIKQ